MPFPDTYPGAKLDLIILVGSVFSEELTFELPAGTPIDLTSHTAVFKVVDECVEDVMDLTTENGGVTITGATGNIVIKANSILTGALTATQGTYTLEVTETSTNETTRALEGSITISPDI